MPLIPFPNVPNVPGVPALLRNATVPSVDSLVNQGISAAIEIIFGAERWGVYDQSGVLALNHDVFLGCEFKNAYMVANYIQEEGAFASYNKVGTPYDFRIRLAVGADKAARGGVLDSLDSMLKSIDTFSVATPERTYTDATLQNYQYRRTARDGARIIVADLWFVEVRRAGETRQKETALPQSQPMVSLGQLQAQAHSVVTGAIMRATDAVNDVVELSPWRVL